MKKNVVIGLGFGDEGKGLTTDYVSSKYTNPLIIRFSGGQQAGHTVMHDEIQHVFSNFGSGTLRGYHTYWSRHCTVDPVGLIKEYNILKKKGLSPVIHVDYRCPITTPYDKFHNKNNQKDLNHGTCGVGVGSTINREEHFYTLTFDDIFNYWVLRTKLNMIKGFYNDVDLDMEEFLYCCEEITRNKSIKLVYNIDKIYEGYDSLIFEGSQGILLDQYFGFFPHVARTNTGTRNVIDILNSINEDINVDTELWLVTRAYQTRHGNGPMSNEHLTHNISDNPDETNKDNKYQGIFRKSILDLSMLQYAINKDDGIRNHPNKNIVITCLDHVENEYRFTHNGELIYCVDEEDFIKNISKILKIKNIFISKYPYSNEIMKHV
jgi:adenylosuccinate synthase